MRFKAFIDGAEGTTGLQLRTRLSAHRDIELLEIEPELRKTGHGMPASARAQNGVSTRVVL